MFIVPLEKYTVDCILNLGKLYTFKFRRLYTSSLRTVYFTYVHKHSYNDVCVLSQDLYRQHFLNDSNNIA